MIKLVSAKCPNCGATLKLSKEGVEVECEYCHNTIIIDDAVACYKLKVSGNVSVEGITTNAELIEAANELLDMKEFLKAKRKFLEFCEKCPGDYQGWLGLLICRTRNFTIRDNNIMFENDINKYREHFFKVAPSNIKQQYFEIIDRYFNPEKYRKMEEEAKAEKRRQELEEQKRKAEERKILLAKDKERKKVEKLEKPIYKTMTEITNKITLILLKIGVGMLYFFGGCCILVGLIGDQQIGEKLLIILLGLSMFKCVYTFIEKNLNIPNEPLLIIRFALPFTLLIIIVSVYPTSDIKEEKPCIKFLNEGAEYKVICVNNGEKIEPPESPVKDGYEFSHWATHHETLDGSEKYDFSKPIENSELVFAYYNKTDNSSSENTT